MSVTESTNMHGGISAKVIPSELGDFVTILGRCKLSAYLDREILLYPSLEEAEQIADKLDEHLVSVGRREKKDDGQILEMWMCHVCEKRWLRVVGLPRETNVCPHCDSCSWEDTERIEEHDAGTIMI